MNSPRRSKRRRSAASSTSSAPNPPVAAAAAGTSFTNDVDSSKKDNNGNTKSNSAREKRRTSRGAKDIPSPQPQDTTVIIHPVSVTTKRSPAEKQPIEAQKKDPASASPEAKNESPTSTTRDHLETATSDTATIRRHSTRRAAATKTPDSKQPASPKRRNKAPITSSEDVTYLYGHPVPPSPRRDVCVTCQEPKRKKRNSDVSLLCDGPGCNREYHLECAGLDTAPADDEPWFCPDCHPDGAALQSMRNYLIQHDEDFFDFCYDFVDDYECAFGAESGVKSSVDEEEKEKFRKQQFADMFVYNLFLEDDSDSGNDFGNAQDLLESHVSDMDRWKKATELLGCGPLLSLVGKPIRLQIPSDADSKKFYHSGRVVDQRDGGAEHLIRFAAGNGRKRDYNHWLRLYEHRLLIGIDVVVGCTAGKPQLVWLRTPRKWLLDRTSDDSACNIARPMSTSRDEAISSQWLLSSLGGKCDYHWSTVRQLHDFVRSSPTDKAYNNCLDWLQATAELVSQRRARDWHILPVANLYGPRAISADSRDQHILPPLLVPANSMQNEAAGLLRLVPNVRHGLDRQKIVSQLERRGIVPTKDVAVHLKVTAVTPLTLSSLQAEGATAFGASI
jgi:hypothetical protein